MTVVAMTGGTGGAKLAHGLQAVLPSGDLTVIANTGDDTERHGLLVMPDHDSVTPKTTPISAPATFVLMRSAPR